MYKKLLLALLLLSTLIFAQTNQPTFNIKTIDGKTFKLEGSSNGLKMPDSLKGKVVLLEFWGTHCPPCLYSIPHYIELTKEYKGKVAMLAVEVQMTPKEQLKQFVAQKGINYNVFTQEENMDFVRYIASRAGWRGAIPFLLVFDTTGNVIAIKVGYVSQKQVRGMVQYALDKANQKLDNNSTKQTDTKVVDKNSTK